MGKIYLVRHGQASFGTSNYDRLSELGKEQGRLLGKWLAETGQRFHTVVTGDMQRHRETAQACMSMLPDGMAPPPAGWVTDAGFNEYDHEQVLQRHRPDFVDPIAVKQFLAEGDDAKRVFQRMFEEAMSRWMSGQHDDEYREPWPVFRERVLAALQRLLDAAGQSQNILVFTSGGTIATLCQKLLGLSDRQMAELNWTLVNAAVTKLLYRPGRVTLSYMNSYAHLEMLGEKHSITYR
jgi:broad specificity phosphatase PhoE